MSKAEFEKARDRAIPWSKDYGPYNNNQEYYAFIKGADWAYEWLTDPENNLGAFKDSLSGLNDHIGNQQKIIEKLTEALESIGCICDAQYSGYDEVEFLARGAPSCECKYFEVLAEAREMQRD